jgi:murein L,D-transpeptidase YcbB/YkuD
VTRLALALLLAAFPAALNAQTAPPLPQTPASAPASPLDLFYAARNQAPVWLQDESTRGAATAFVALLRNADLDGLADGPQLAATVEAAIGANDDRTISAAWVRFVQALKAPVKEVSFGDPALQLEAPREAAILAALAKAPSLADYVKQTAAVNPFYAALRDAAVKQGATADPHVRATLDRLRLIPSKGRLILVDAANAQLMLLDDGRVVDSMKVIVGQPKFPTPLLAGKIWYVTFNPYWHIPHDVAQRKVAPIVLKRGVSYLKAARYETVAAFGKDDLIDPASVDWKGVANGSVQVNIRQLNGPNNMMGKMKFGFANDYGVFLHDTPHKDLFAKAKRDLSLGCVRLERPEAVAQWLLGRDPLPPSDDVEQHVPVDGGVPIYITYMTARPDGDTIAYADDVYGLDVPGAPKTQVAAAADGDSKAQ